MTTYRCPECKGEKFLVTVHVTQTWEVDTNGDFLKEVSSCDEVTHRPDNEDIWTCAHPGCGWSGAGQDAIQEN